MITLGITVCTIMSSSQKASSEAVDPADDKFWLTIGICLLTFALFLSARMGIYQEVK